jgi:hypothetical protein
VLVMRLGRPVSYGLQALAMLAAFGDAVDQQWLQARLRREGALATYQALKDLQASPEMVSEGVLQKLLDTVQEEGL